MLLCVSPSKLTGKITAPGSKAHTIHALAVAMLTDGVSVIRAPLVSEDTLTCIRIASAMGAWIHRGNDTDWRIHGNAGHILTPAKNLYLENAETEFSIFPALAALASDTISFSYDNYLTRQDICSLLNPLEKLGAVCNSDYARSLFSVRGPLSGGETTLDEISSRYASAFLLACPLTRQDTILNFPFSDKRSHMGMTLEWLKRQKIQLKYNKNLTRFHIVGGQKYHTFIEQIPGDFSCAAYSIAAAVITGGSVRVSNLKLNDSQSEKHLINLLEQMGANIQKGVNCVSVSSVKSRLHAAELDLSPVPDLLPVLAVVAACADGVTVLKNAKPDRLQKNNRISLIRTELTKMGIQVVEFENGIAVTGGKLIPAHVDSHHDHQIAMSLAIAGMACSDSTHMTVIDGAECIRTTYPDFIRDFVNAGAAFNLCKI